MAFDWRRPKSGFPFRSAKRDVETDSARAQSIVHAIDKVMREAEKERDGLSRRLADVLARSSVTIGTASDEYLTRDSLKDENQTALGGEIRSAESRLRQLDENIAHYRSLRAFAANALQPK